MVMQPAICRLTTEKIDEALKQMRGWKEDYAYVFRDDEYHGVVTQDVLEEACEKPDDKAPDLIDIAKDGPTLQLDTILQDALPATLGSDFPIPVVSDDGEYRGTLSKEDMVDILASSNADGPGNDN